MSMTSANLSVTRAKSLRRDVFRAYEVWVDGVCTGKVKRGATLRLPVAPGPHTVQMKIDWCTSPELRIDVPEGGDARLSCGPNPTDEGALRQVLSNASSYLWLRETDEPG